MKRIATLLVTVALITSMMGCSKTATVQQDRYLLTLAVNPPGSGTAVDITDNSPYSAGVAVSIVAEAAAGYRFAGWSTPAGLFGDENAAESTFTMPAQDVTITATFAEGQAILTWHDLDAIRDELTGTYFLMNDLESTTAGFAELAGPAANDGLGWQPIGSRDTGFAGTFDGRGHEIRDLFIARADEDCVGLFGVLDGEGMIKNVSLANAAVTGENYVGGLVGDNWEGTVTGCRSSGSVTGHNYIGGLVGISDGTVSNSLSRCTVVGDSWIGGLIGCNEGIVSNCYSAGSVTGDWGVGGLVGDNFGGTITKSYSTGGVAGNWWVGGIVGVNTGTVTNSFWNTVTSGTNDSDGGTGKTTIEMKDIATFADPATEGLDTPWDIAPVGDPTERNLNSTWNMVDAVTYPFLSWQPAS